MAFLFTYMKKLKQFITNIFKDKKKRYLYLFLFVLPLLIAITIFGIIVFKDVKELININGNSETNTKYIIGNKDYVLRDNATDYQFELFSELKDMLEVGEGYTDLQIVESICKNYVADFYTWSNKFGQYDVGGLYYVYTPQKENIYIQARDGFYRYISDYIEKYKSENLLKVNLVEATASTIDDYLIEETGQEFKTYKVKCTWNYEPNEIFSTSRYQSRAEFIVVENERRFEIIETHE